MTAEKTFQAELMLRVGSRPYARLWRQNCGKIPVRDRTGKTARVFNAGPPKGAADISGIILPEGWRLEIEVKAGKGKRSPAQESWAAFIERSGGVYVLLAYDEARSLTSNLELAEQSILRAVDARRARRL